MSEPEGIPDFIPLEDDPTGLSSLFAQYGQATQGPAAQALPFTLPKPVPMSAPKPSPEAPTQDFSLKADTVDAAALGHWNTKRQSALNELANVMSEASKEEAGEIMDTYEPVSGVTGGSGMGYGAFSQPLKVDSTLRAARRMNKLAEIKKTIAEADAGIAANTRPGPAGPNMANQIFQGAEPMAYAMAPQVAAWGIGLLGAPETLGASMALPLGAAVTSGGIMGKHAYDATAAQALMQYGAEKGIDITSPEGMKIAMSDPDFVAYRDRLALKVGAVSTVTGTALGVAPGVAQAATKGVVGKALLGTGIEGVQRISPLRTLATNAAGQAAGLSTAVGLGTGQQVATNYVSGKPLGEGVAETASLFAVQDALLRTVHAPFNPRTQTIADAVNAAPDSATFFKSPVWGQMVSMAEAAGMPKGLNPTEQRAWMRSNAEAVLARKAKDVTPQPVGPERQIVPQPEATAKPEAPVAPPVAPAPSVADVIVPPVQGSALPEGVIPPRPTYDERFQDRGDAGLDEYRAAVDAWNAQYGNTQKPKSAPPEPVKPTRTFSLDEVSDPSGTPDFIPLDDGTALSARDEAQPDSTVHTQSGELANHGDKDLASRGFITQEATKMPTDLAGVKLVIEPSGSFEDNPNNAGMFNGQLMLKGRQIAEFTYDNHSFDGDDNTKLDWIKVAPGQRGKGLSKVIQAEILERARRLNDPSQTITMSVVDPKQRPTGGLRSLIGDDNVRDNGPDYSESERGEPFAFKDPDTGEWIQQINEVSGDIPQYTPEQRQLINDINAANAAGDNAKASQLKAQFDQSVQDNGTQILSARDEEPQGYSPQELRQADRNVKPSSVTNYDVTADITNSKGKRETKVIAVQADSMAEAKRKAIATAEGKGLQVHKITDVKQVSKFPMVGLQGEKPKVGQKVTQTPSSAEGWTNLFNNVDRALSHSKTLPDLGLAENWSRVISLALPGGTGDLPPAPLRLHEWATKPEAFKRFFDEANGNNPELIRSAVTGLSSLEPVHAAAMKGQLPTRMVALHFMWGALSKMLGPFEQEAGWIKLTNSPEILRALDQSISGHFNMSREEWMKLTGDAIRLGEDLKAGNNSISNANAFHLTLTKWNGRWDQLTAIINNPELSGPGMRREIYRSGLGAGSGFGYKVLSFNLLTLARRDMFIGDRWQFVNMWFPHLMATAGEGGVFSYNAKGIPEDTTRAYKSLNTLDKEASAEAVYSLVEAGLQKVADDARPWLEPILGRRPLASDIHWLSWNIIKNEPVGHSSLDSSTRALQEGLYGKADFTQSFPGLEKSTEQYTGDGTYRVFGGNREQLGYSERRSGEGDAGLRPADPQNDAGRGEAGPARSADGRDGPGEVNSARDEVDRKAAELDRRIDARRQAQERNTNPETARRGNEQIAQRLVNELRNGGKLTSQEVTAALRIVEKLAENGYLDNLKVSVSVANPGEAVRGGYEPASELVKLFVRNTNRPGVFRSTFAHEVAHHLERMIPAKDLEAARQQFLRERAKWLKDKFGYRELLGEGNWLDKSWSHQDIVDFAAKNDINMSEFGKYFMKDMGTGRWRIKRTDETYRLTNFSEFFAENVANLASARDDARVNPQDMPGVWARIKDLFAKIKQSLVDAFGKDKVAKIWDKFQRGEYSSDFKRDKLHGYDRARNTSPVADDVRTADYRGRRMGPADQDRQTRVDNIDKLEPNKPIPRTQSARDEGYHAGQARIKRERLGQLMTELDSLERARDKAEGRDGGPGESNPVRLNRARDDVKSMYERIDALKKSISDDEYFAGQSAESARDDGENTPIPGGYREAFFQAKKGAGAPEPKRIKWWTEVGHDTSADTSKQFLWVIDAKGELKITSIEDLHEKLGGTPFDSEDSNGQGPTHLDWADDESSERGLLDGPAHGRVDATGDVVRISMVQKGQSDPALKADMRDYVKSKLAEAVGVEPFDVRGYDFTDAGPFNEGPTVFSARDEGPQHLGIERAFPATEDDAELGLFSKRAQALFKKGYSLQIDNKPHSGEGAGITPDVRLKAPDGTYLARVSISFRLNKDGGLVKSPARPKDGFPNRGGTADLTAYSEPSIDRSRLRLDYRFTKNTTLQEQVSASKEILEEAQKYADELKDVRIVSQEELAQLDRNYRPGGPLYKTAKDFEFYKQRTLEHLDYAKKRWAETPKTEAEFKRWQDAKLAKLQSDSDNVGQHDNALVGMFSEIIERLRQMGVTRVNFDTLDHGRRTIDIETATAKIRNSMAESAEGDIAGLSEGPEVVPTIDNIDVQGNMFTALQVAAKKASPDEWINHDDNWSDASYAIDPNTAYSARDEEPAGRQFVPVEKLFNEEPATADSLYSPTAKKNLPAGSTMEFGPLTEPYGADRSYGTWKDGVKQNDYSAHKIYVRDSEGNVIAEANVIADTSRVFTKRPKYLDGKIQRKAPKLEEGWAMTVEMIAGGSARAQVAIAAEAVERAKMAGATMVIVPFKGWDHREAVGQLISKLEGTEEVKIDDEIDALNVVFKQNTPDYASAEDGDAAYGIRRDQVYSARDEEPAPRKLKADPVVTGSGRDARYPKGEEFPREYEDGGVEMYNILGRNKASPERMRQIQEFVKDSAVKHALYRGQDSAYETPDTARARDGLIHLAGDPDYAAQYAESPGKSVPEKGTDHAIAQVYMNAKNILDLSQFGHTISDKNASAMVPKMADDIARQIAGFKGLDAIKDGEQIANLRDEILDALRYEFIDHYTGKLRGENVWKALIPLSKIVDIFGKHGVEAVKYSDSDLRTAVGEKRGGKVSYAVADPSRIKAAFGDNDVNPDTGNIFQSARDEEAPSTTPALPEVSTPKGGLIAAVAAMTPTAAEAATRAGSAAAAVSTMDLVTAAAALGLAGNDRLLSGLNPIVANMHLLARDTKSATIRSVAEMFNRMGGNVAEGAQETYFEERDGNRRMLRNKLVEAFKPLAHLSEADLKALDQDIAMALAGEKTLTGAEGQVVSNLQAFSDELFDYLSSAGVKVNYAKDYGMPHSFNSEKVLTDDQAFLSDATRAYQVNNPMRIKRLTDYIQQIQNQAAARGGMTAEMVERTAELNKEINELQNAKPAEQAQALLDAIDTSNAGGDSTQGLLLEAQGTGQNKADFTRERIFEPAARRILRDYFNNDPRHAWNSYIARATTLAEFARRFGGDGSKWTDMVRQMRVEKVSNKDITRIKNMVLDSLGVLNTAPTEGHALAVSVLGLSNMAKLKSTALTNFLEAQAQAIPGNLAHTITAPVNMLGQFMAIVTELPPRQQAQLKNLIGMELSTETGSMELARAVGLIDAAGVHEMMENSAWNIESAADFAGATKVDKLARGVSSATGAMARAYGIEATENAKRAMATKYAANRLDAHVSEFLRDGLLARAWDKANINNPYPPANPFTLRNEAVMRLRRAGVSDAQMTAFAQWWETARAKDFNAAIKGNDPMAKLARKVIRMETARASVNTNRAMKPGGKENPLVSQDTFAGKAMMTFLNYPATFAQQIAKPMVRDIKTAARGYESEGGQSTFYSGFERTRMGARALAIPAMAVSAAVFLALRAWATGHEDDVKNKPLWKHLVEGLTYTGITGGKSEFASRVSRGQLPPVFDEGNRLVRDINRNDDKKNGKERAVTEGAIRGVGVPTALGASSTLLPVPLAAVLNQVLASKTFRDMATDFIAGPEAPKGQGQAGAREGGSSQKREGGSRPGSR